jgi:hypothetical protein
MAPGRAADGAVGPLRAWFWAVSGVCGGGGGGGVRFPSAAATTTTTAHASIAGGSVG